MNRKRYSRFKRELLADAKEVAFNAAVAGAGAAVVTAVFPTVPSGLAVAVALAVVHVARVFGLFKKFRSRKPKDPKRHLHVVAA